MKVMNGFIIDHYWDDRSQNLYLFLKTPQGLLKITQSTERALFFVAQDSLIPSNIHYDEIREIPLKSFDKKPVKALYFKRLEDCNNAKENLARSGVRTYENDIRIDSRFLMERFIFGSAMVEGEINYDEASQTHQVLNPKLTPSQFIPRLTSLSLDIETSRENQLLSIGLAYYDGDDLKKEICFMLADYDELINEKLLLCDSEKKLLIKLNEFFKSYDPDLILGWHIVGFDLKFLFNKSLEFNTPLYLSRNQDKLNVFEIGNNSFCDLRGRQIIDGPPTLRQNFFSFKNYKLDTVAHELLGVGKDIDSTGESKVEEIERRFREDKEGLAFYNLMDCKLVFDVYKKIDLFNLLIARSFNSGQKLEKVGLSSASFDHFFLPKLHRLGFVAPNIVDIEREESSTGGMVLEPKVGLFKNVAVFDFKSLYPSIMRTFFIDPYSLLMNDISPISTPSGHTYSSSEYILADYIEELMNKRAMAKEQDNSSLSQAIKILMNSFYGIMGSFRSRFYHSDLPASITQSGHWILERSIEFFNNKSLEVIYGDTDSLFVHFDQEMSQDSLDRLTIDLNHYLNILIQDEFKVKSRLEVEFEKMYEKIYFSPMRNSSEGAKKRYVGYIAGKMNFVGMEYVRSDWTELAKNLQFNLFEALFQGESLENIIKETISNIENGIYSDELIYTKRLSKRPSEYTKNIPPHIKAALELPVDQQNTLREISYIMTLAGPKEVGNNQYKPDTKHYIEKQIRPIAQSLLSSIGVSFDSLIEGDQLTFF